ncbi:MAG: hypothetical protein AMJ92_06115 [candidate division Zixibacteria bacterium SM23_81]|nr:MAG: hypothetical protein AMJ92_06115 [candidate division Zixibacteria bacterium SM23_81]
MIEVFLEKAKGGYMAHLFSHLGCVARARSARGLEKAVAEALGRYEEIARRRNFAATPVRRPFKIKVVEEVSGMPIWESGNPAALFGPDLEALTPEAVQSGFRIMEGLRAELLAKVRELEPAQLQAQRDPNRRSLGQTLEHLADCEWWYLSRIDDDLPYFEDKCPKGIFPRLAWLLDKARQYLLELPVERQALVFVPHRHPTSDPAERWTPRKVLRRLLEHEFEHLSAIDRDIAAAKKARHRAGG